LEFGQDWDLVMFTLEVVGRGVVDDQEALYGDGIYTVLILPLVFLFNGNSLSSVFPFFVEIIPLARLTFFLPSTSIIDKILVVQG